MTKIKKAAILLSLCLLFSSYTFLLSGCASNEEKVLPTETPVNIDIDLSILNSTMSYAQTFDMLINPKNYEGKIVKMKGQFAKYFDNIENKTYYTVNIFDQGGCCSMGVEFLAKDIDESEYPNDGEEIVVTGVFQTYMENGNLYATLADAALSK